VFAKQARWEAKWLVIWLEDQSSCGDGESKAGMHGVNIAMDAALSWQNLGFLCPF